MYSWLYQVWKGLVLVSCAWGAHGERERQKWCRQFLSLLEKKRREGFLIWWMVPKGSRSELSIINIVVLKFAMSSQLLLPPKSRFSFCLRVQMVAIVVKLFFAKPWFRTLCSASFKWCYRTKNRWLNCMAALAALPFFSSNKGEQNWIVLKVIDITWEN